MNEPPDAARAEADRERSAASGDFYRNVLATLTEAGVRFLVGGGYALQHYTGIARRSRDLDVFVRRDDCDRTLAVLSAAGYHTELTHPHWLGKTFGHGGYVDVIFSSGNAVAEVDEDWFAHAPEAAVLGVPTRLVPREEMIWSKAFIMERQRYDGADVAHLLRAGAGSIDWQRLLDRFGPHWRVLLSHLVLFGFIYGSDRDLVPRWVVRELLSRLESELEGEPPIERVCNGTLLSSAQFRIDTELWGYADGRVAPRGRMTAEEAERWTAIVWVQQAGAATELGIPASAARVSEPPSEAA